MEEKIFVTTSLFMTLLRLYMLFLCNSVVDFFKTTVKKIGVKVQWKIPLFQKIGPIFITSHFLMLVTLIFRPETSDGAGT